jgi:hypothetical protein
MLQYLSSPFISSDDRPPGVDDDLIAAATDRVVQGTDKRLMGFSNYRKLLRDPVEKADVHVINMIDGLPEPVEISHRTYSSDPRLHAYFASIDHLKEKIGTSHSVVPCMKQARCDETGRVYGLLTVQWQEATRLGTVLQDDRILREFQQISVNFLNHNFLGPSDLLDEALLNAKKRAFDFMIAIAMERIIAERTSRAELEVQQRLLKRKLTAMKAGNWGLEEMLRPEKSGVKDLRSMEMEIGYVEEELNKLGASHEVLGRNLQIINDTLGHPEALLSTRFIEMNLDSMNIKADSSIAARTNRIELTEVSSSIGVSRIILPGWVHVQELPSGSESISTAMRYL